MSFETDVVTLKQVKLKKSARRSKYDKLIDSLLRLKPGKVLRVARPRDKKMRNFRDNLDNGLVYRMRHRGCSRSQFSILILADEAGVAIVRKAIKPAAAKKRKR